MNFAKIPSWEAFFSNFNQNPPVESAEIQNPPVESAEIQNPPVESAEIQNPPVESTEIQNPPVEPVEIIIDHSIETIQPTLNEEIPTEVIESIMTGLREDPHLESIFLDMDMDIDIDCDEISPLEKELALW